jgi:transposase
MLSGEADATPKTHDGPVEALRTLKVAQRSASKARTQAPNQLRALLVTAPDELRARLRDLSLDPPRLWGRRAGRNVGMPLWCRRIDLL